MALLINLLVFAIAFAIVAWAGKWVCEAFKAPEPFLWIFGGFLLVCLLLFIAGLVGVVPLPSPGLRLR